MAAKKKQSTITCSRWLRKKARMHRTKSARRWSGACMEIAILGDLGRRFESESCFGDGVSRRVGPEGQVENVE